MDHCVAGVCAVVTTWPILLITGTSSGIGFSTAISTASAGFTVIATMRDTAKSDQLKAAAKDASVTVDIQPLDVTDQASIEACFRHIQSTYGRLDAVLNNAGSGHVGTTEVDDLDSMRAVMEVNFFGVVAATRAAMPLLRESRGRLVTVSSVGGVIWQPFNEAYCAAKFAVEGYVESLAPVVASLGVRVTVVEPGAVVTEFVTNAGVGATRPTDGTVYAPPAFAAYLERTATAFDPANAQTPDEVAAVILEVLTSDAPPTRVQTSDRARGFVGIKMKDLDGSAVQTLTTGWITPSA